MYKQSELSDVVSACGNNICRQVGVGVAVVAVLVGSTCKGGFTCRRSRSSFSIFLSSGNRNSDTNLQAKLILERSSTYDVIL